MSHVSVQQPLYTRFMIILLSGLFILSAAEAQDEDKTVHLLLGDVSLNKLPFVMAYEQGMYKSNDLDVVPVFTRSSVETIRRSGLNLPDEVISKPGMNSPIRISGASPAIVRLTTEAGSPDLIIIGSTHMRSRWHIIGRKDITSAEQLKGKRIGYSGYGAVSHLEAVTFSRAMGWDPQFDVSLMADGLAVEALQNGYIDAFVADNIHGTMAIGAGYHVIVDLADYGFPVAGSSIMVDRDWLKANPDAARRFMKATVEAIALLKNDREAAFATIRKWYLLNDIELLHYFYQGVERMPIKPYPAVEGIQHVMQVYDSHEMRKYSVEHFYDDTYVRELDQSGYIDSLYH